MIRSITSFVTSMWLWFRGGMSLAPLSIVRLRWGVCRRCYLMKRGWFRYSCRLCKCTLSIGRHPFNKLAHPCQQCPSGYWTQLMGIECPEEEKHEAK